MNFALQNFKPAKYEAPEKQLAPYAMLGPPLSAHSLHHILLPGGTIAQQYKGVIICHYFE